MRRLLTALSMAVLILTMLTGVVSADHGFITPTSVRQVYVP